MLLSSIRNLSLHSFRLWEPSRLISFSFSFCWFLKLLNNITKKRGLLTSSTFFPGIAKHPCTHLRVKAHALAWASELFTLVYVLYFGEFGKNKNLSGRFFMFIYFLRNLSYRHSILVSSYNQFCILCCKNTNRIWNNKKFHGKSASYHLFSYSNVTGSQAELNGQSAPG